MTKRIETIGNPNDQTGNPPGTARPGEAKPGTAGQGKANQGEETNTQVEFLQIEAAQPTRPRVKGLAYSGNKMRLPGWPHPVVVDLAGLEIPAEIPLLLDHRNQTTARVGVIADGSSTLRLRGYAALPWSAGDTIELMGDIDIGLDAPSTNQFESPADEAQAPAGVAFQDAPSYSKGLSIGSLASSSIYGVWRREWIMDPHSAREGIDADTFYAWS